MNFTLLKIAMHSFPSENLLNKFHICTVASKKNKNLQRLINSGKKHHIDIKILGLDKPYFSHSQKLFYMQKFLNALPEDDIVMFVDAYDVLIIMDKSLILEKFLQKKTPILFAAEKNCWPLDNVKDKFPKSPTPFRYINTGTYMGYVHFLKKWMEDLSPIDINKCDQSQISLHYLKNQNSYPLDFYCDLFLPLFNVRKKELSLKNKRLHCLTTDSMPAVIHANGKIKYKLKRFYDTLISQ